MSALNPFEESKLNGIPRHVATKKGLPNRWNYCPKFGDLIDGTFVPLKTPLGWSYEGLLEPANMFHPADVFAASFNDTADGSKIKLWINLANTERYYGTRKITDIGCRYEWMPITGYEESPPVEEVEKFVQIVQDFKKKNPDDIIAVHCTHGFNRTGFMVVSYLVMAAKMDLKSAVKTFADARPTGIYKEEYLKELYLRFLDGFKAGDALPFAVPERPSWE